jgi:RNA-splicing ligase RtcB
MNCSELIGYFPIHFSDDFINHALREIKKPVIRKELAYLEGQGFKDYMNDMKIAQKYAFLNFT